MLELVDVGVGGHEFPNPGHVVAHGDRLGPGRVGLLGESGYFDVAETVSGKQRLEHVLPRARADEQVGGLGRAQVLGVEASVAVEDFPVPKLDLTPGLLARKLDAHAPGEVLPEVQDP